MLSVQNSETWVLSPTNPKPNQFPPASRADSFPRRSHFVPKTEPVLPKLGDGFSPKTEHVFPKNRNCFSQKRNFPKVGGWFPESRWQISPKSSKVGDGFSQSRWRSFPKSVTDFLKVCGWFFRKSVADFPKIGDTFPQSRWLIFSKSVTDFSKAVAGFPKVCHGFSQSRWRISPKSVTDFLKIGDGFPQSRWQLSSKSVADSPNVGRWLISWEPSLVSRNPNSQSQKFQTHFNYVHTCYYLLKTQKQWGIASPQSARGACRWVPWQQLSLRGLNSERIEQTVLGSKNEELFLRSWQSSGRNSVLIAWLRPFFQRNGLQEKHFSFLSASCCN